MNTPLLLLPGLQSDARLFEPQVAGLADLAPATVADFAHADTIASMAIKAVALMPPGRFAVAGLSMGGYVALEIMRQAGGRVSALALLNTNARADTPEGTANRHRLVALAESDLAGVVDMLLPKLLHPDHLADAALVSLLHDMARGVGFAGFKRQQAAIIGRIDSRPHLAAIRVPTLVVAGAEDAIMPREVSQEMASGIPGARLEIVPRCGHLSTLEQPQATTAALRAWITSAAG